MNYTCEKLVKIICEKLVIFNLLITAALFEKQTENLSSFQMNFLRAMIDGVENEFTSQVILHKYNLGSSANVSIIKKALIKKEIIDIENKNVSFADPILKYWLKKEFYQ